MRRRSTQNAAAIYGAAVLARRMKHEALDVGGRAHGTCKDLTSMMGTCKNMTSAFPAQPPPPHEAAAAQPADKRADEALQAQMTALSAQVAALTDVIKGMQAGVHAGKPSAPAPPQTITGALDNLSQRISSAWSLSPAPPAPAPTPPAPPETVPSPLVPAPSRMTPPEPPEGRVSEYRMQAIPEIGDVEYDASAGAGEQATKTDKHVKLTAPVDMNC